MRWSFVLIISGLLTSGIRAETKPNILLICVDDLKPILGCYGDKVVKSPNIDRLAKRGVVFTHAYCNQAVCSPSRNALLTGLRSDTLGIYDLPTNFRKSRPDAITLPQYFKNHGYRTEGLGKIFHVGHGNHEDPASWSVPHFSAKSIGYALEENKAAPTREGALFENKNPAGLARGAAYESAEVADNAYGDGLLAEEAVRRLKIAAAKPDQPFFLAVGFLKPHLPFCAPKKYWDLYNPAVFQLATRKDPPLGAPAYAAQFGGELRNYKNMPANGPIPEATQRTLIHGYHAAISYMDAQLGKVLDALDAAGLAKNTLIVLWGDHGWHLGDHGIWCKHTNYEQATRIPLLISAPGMAQGISHSMAESVDLYPTLAHLAGLPAPSGLDGTSLAPVLSDPTARVKDFIFHVYPRGNRLGRAVRTSAHRLVEWKNFGPSSEEAVYELYDYVKDPQESKNLAPEQPEEVARLRAILDKRPPAKAPVRDDGAKQKAKKGKA
ncbi:MAG: iduronate-2-sulfatase [Gemmataceae bacterium]|nr:iduronate-2-sulfatase [Gemmataceae bacterium]